MATPTILDTLPITPVASAATGTDLTGSFAFTTATGPNNIVFFVMAWSGDPGSIITAPAYSGTPMTQISTTRTNAASACTMWYYLAPTGGVLISGPKWTNAQKYVYAVFTVKDVDQSTIFRDQGGVNFNAASGSAAASSVTGTLTSTTDLILALSCETARPTVSSRTGTQISTGNSTGGGAATCSAMDCQFLAPAGTSQTMTTTWSAGAVNTILTVSLLLAPAGLPPEGTFVNQSLMRAANW